MRYRFTIGMSFLHVVAPYRDVAISLAVGMAIGATVTGVNARKRHQRLVRKHQGDLRTAFSVGVEAHARKHPS